MNYNGIELTEGEFTLSDKSNEKTYYEVWGNDTFANETYFCGRYEDRDKAMKALADAKQDALSQTESLRDTFWMTETTMGKIKERERLEDERRGRIYKRWHYDDDRLRNHVILLVKQLAEVVDMDERGLINERITFLQENNPHEEDCYIYVALEYYKGERGNAVGTVIKFRDGGGSSHTCVLVDLHEVNPCEELYSKLIKIFEKTIRDEMLDSL